MRLDKMLANMGVGSRKQVKALIKKKLVTVNDVIVRDSGMHIDVANDVVAVEGKVITYEKYVYFMLHKPKGVLSATRDNHTKTVIDILHPAHRHFEPFPVGRLDKDTEGLLLLTNDGDLAHQLLSPKKNVDKTYFAEVQGKVTEEDIIRFKQGVDIGEDALTKPAELVILEAGEISTIELTITEGKFHQVKRMFRAVGKEVLYLKRLRMGELSLDPELALGEYRRLNEKELAYCNQVKQS